MEKNNNIILDQNKIDPIIQKEEKIDHNNNNISQKQESDNKINNNKNKVNQNIKDQSPKNNKDKSTVCNNIKNESDELFIKNTTSTNEKIDFDAEDFYNILIKFNDKNKRRIKKLISLKNLEKECTLLKNQINNMEHCLVPGKGKSDTERKSNYSAVSDKFFKYGKYNQAYEDYSKEVLFENNNLPVLSPTSIAITGDGIDLSQSKYVNNLTIPGGDLKLEISEDLITILTKAGSVKKSNKNNSKFFYVIVFNWIKNGDRPVLIYNYIAYN